MSEGRCNRVFDPQRACQRRSVTFGSLWGRARATCQAVVETYEELVETYEDLVETYEDLVEAYDDMGGASRAIEDRRASDSNPTRSPHRIAKINSQGRKWLK